NLSYTHEIPGKFIYRSWWERQPFAVKATIFAAGGIVLYLGICVAVFWLRPLWILKVNTFLKPMGFKITKPVEWTVSLRYILLVAFFNYRGRILDAWVAQYIDRVAENFFQKKDTVKERANYVPLPVEFDGKVEPELTVARLRPLFRGQQVRVLIWGEGGAG